MIKLGECRRHQKLASIGALRPTHATNRTPCASIARCERSFDVIWRKRTRVVVPQPNEVEKPRSLPTARVQLNLEQEAQVVLLGILRVSAFAWHARSPGVETAQSWDILGPAHSVADARARERGTEREAHKRTKLVPVRQLVPVRVGTHRRPGAPAVAPAVAHGRTSLPS
jgi:hypothetical protein